MPAGDQWSPLRFSAMRGYVFINLADPQNYPLTGRVLHAILSMLVIANLANFQFALITPLRGSLPVQGGFMERLVSKY